jgi:hypothetical protein
LKVSNAISKVKIMGQKGVRVMFPGSQHFGGKKGVLELWDGD